MLTGCDDIFPRCLTAPSQWNEMVHCQIYNGSCPVTVLASITVAQVDVLSGKAGTTKFSIAGRRIVQADDPWDSVRARDASDQSGRLNHRRCALGKEKNETRVNTDNFHRFVA
jgi:hypothetical protein